MYRPTNSRVQKFTHPCLIRDRLRESKDGFTENSISSWSSTKVPGLRRNFPYQKRFKVSAKVFFSSHQILHDLPSCYLNNNCLLINRVCSKHVKNTHDRPIICLASEHGFVECDKAYGEKSDMEKHVWSKHKMFATAAGLKERRKECAYCRRLVYRLKRHIKEIHKGEKRKKA